MLHALYIIAFAILSVVAISNLIRNIALLGSDARRDDRSGSGSPSGDRSRSRFGRAIPHPEMLDEKGRILDEPLLVMKSISLEDARERLDALYDNNPSSAPDSLSEDDSQSL